MSNVSNTRWAEEEEEEGFLFLWDPKLVAGDLPSPPLPKLLGNVPTIYFPPLFRRHSFEAKFLWKRIPVSVREICPEIGHLWTVGQALHAKDPPAVHSSLQRPDWSPEAQPYVNHLKGNYGAIEGLLIPLSLTS